MQNTIVMLAAGVGIPVMAALNGGLGRHIGSPIMAAVMLFAVALLASLAAAVSMGDFSKLGAVVSAPHTLKLGGLFVAFYVLSITTIGPRIGLANAIVLVLLGQLISSTVIDHFGYFGAMVRTISFTRLMGLILLTAGTVMFAR